MKPVRLRHDGPITVYMVPDEVAKNLRRYCLEFCEWMQDSPEAAAAYWTGSGFAYGAADFIEYLNTHHFPDQPSYPVCDEDSKEYREYRSAPYFDF